MSMEEEFRKRGGGSSSRITQINTVPTLRRNTIRQSRGESGWRRSVWQKSVLAFEAFHLPLKEKDSKPTSTIFQIEFITM